MLWPGGISESHLKTEKKIYIHICQCGILLLAQHNWVFFLKTCLAIHDILCIIFMTVTKYNYNVLFQIIIILLNNDIKFCLCQYIRYLRK